MIKPKSKTATNVGAGTADPVVMGKPDLGYTPGDVDAVLQVWVTGLDGGTYDVLFYVPNDAIPKAHVAAATSVDIVTLDAPAVTAVRVTFAGLGGAAAPVVYVSGRLRR